MPPGRKRASAHVFTSEDAEHERADEAKYTTYYCKFCGQHVMTSTCDDLSALPRRRTDGALMLDLAKHPTRILAALDAEVVAVRGRDGTYEKRQRARCGTTPVGYRDASRGANARAPIAPPAPSIRARPAFPPAASHSPFEEPQEARTRVRRPRPHRQAPQAPRRPR